MKRSIVTDKLKAIYRVSVFSLSGLSYIKNKYNLTDFGIFLVTKISTRFGIGLDNASLTIIGLSKYEQIEVEQFLNLK